MNEKLFTLAEARAALPRVRKLVEAMMESRKRIVVLQPELWPAIEAAAGNGGVPVAGELIRWSEQLRASFQELTAMGIHVQDVGRGLIDFPALRDGHEIYLCWMHPEPEIGWWHEMDAGFAGRRPLEA